jgi:hypothetical protein
LLLCTVATCRLQGTLHGTDHTAKSRKGCCDVTLSRRLPLLVATFNGPSAATGYSLQQLRLKIGETPTRRNNRHINYIVNLSPVPHRLHRSSCCGGPPLTELVRLTAVTICVCSNVSLKESSVRYEITHGCIEKTIPESMITTSWRYD